MGYHHCRLEGHGTDPTGGVLSVVSTDWKVRKEEPIIVQWDGATVQNTVYMHRSPCAYRGPTADQLRLTDRPIDRLT
jgi:hypothetical protein